MFQALIKFLLDSISYACISSAIAFGCSFVIITLMLSISTKQNPFTSKINMLALSAFKLFASPVGLLACVTLISANYLCNDSNMPIWWQYGIFTLIATSYFSYNSLKILLKSNQLLQNTAEALGTNLWQRIIYLLIPEELPCLIAIMLDTLALLISLVACIKTIFIHYAVPVSLDKITLSPSMLIIILATTLCLTLFLHSLGRTINPIYKHTN